MKQTVLFTDLGKNRSYQEIWDLQERMLQQKVKLKLEERETASVNERNLSNAQPSTNNAQSSTYNAQSSAPHDLFFVEHSPVYTLGKSGAIGNVLINEEQRLQKGIEFFRINRGGDITFHGPGQLVGYPIMDLEKFKPDLGWYLRSLEEVIILTIDSYGLKGGRSKGETGVWLDPEIKGKERKICAFGIRCSRWITMHGFALNVNTDLNYFNYIVPCGIQNKQVTSLENELGYKVDMEEVKEKVKNSFEEVFQVELIAEN